MKVAEDLKTYRKPVGPALCLGCQRPLRQKYHPALRYLKDDGVFEEQFSESGLLFCDKFCEELYRKSLSHRRLAKPWKAKKKTKRT